MTTWKVSSIAGSRVETESGEFLGELADVLPTGANDVFVVRKGNEEMLIPATKSVVLEILVQEKRIRVRLPEGLREIYAPPKSS